MEEEIIENKFTKEIKIVDDIMGTGKSTWAIKFINHNKDKNFLCVLPTLSECERYKEKTNIDIINPECWGTKWKHFKFLVNNNQSIVTTHALIAKMDLDMLEMLKSKEYTLIIDECLDVLSPYKISKDDTKIIFNEGLVSIDDDGFLLWNEERKPYKGAFADIKRLCSFKSLMGFKRNNSDELARILMWNFPVDFFKCFNDSYIFTYLWDGSIQKSYFDIHEIQYEKYMLDDNKELIPHDKDLEYAKRRQVCDLINIYEGKFNEIGDRIGKSNPLSKSWYEDRRKKNILIFEQLKKNTENYFRTISETTSDDNMYTVFKMFNKYVKGKGYSKGFVPCNARGTNDFRNKKALAYLINYFVNPDIKTFINHYNIEFDENLFSLSALLQWMWRSQIRDNKEIQVYIPSERMRYILYNWIHQCKCEYKSA